MFDIGFWELVLIGVVALLVVGPERLPGLARQVGTWIGKTKRFVNSVRADIERELEADELKRVLSEQQNELRQLRGMISDTRAEVRAEVRQTQTLAEEVKEQATSALRQATAGNVSSGSGPQAAADPGSTTSDHGAKRSSGD